MFLDPLVVAVLAITFSLDPSLAVQLFVAVVLPLLVGIVTNRVTSSARKAVLLALLAFVASIANELLTAINAGVDFDLGRSVLLFGGTFLVSVGTYFGFWKPTGAAGAAQDALTATQPRDAQGRFISKNTPEGDAE